LENSTCKYGFQGGKVGVSGDFLAFFEAVFEAFLRHFKDISEALFAGK